MLHIQSKTVKCSRGMMLNDYTWPLPTGLYSVILSHGHFKAGGHFRDQPVNLTSFSAHQRAKAV